MPPPEFSPEFQRQFEELLLWRRDVRHFLKTPVGAELIHSLLRAAILAPSVGFSQAWRWILVESEEGRNAVRSNFESCNAEALKGYHGDRAAQYAQLKLSGLSDAPVHIAVFADEGSDTGHGLGQRTMPETKVWSVVMAIHTLWLAARSVGLGLGWVSILNPSTINTDLDIPAGWRFVAYLCIGWPEAEVDRPLLELVDWEARIPFDRVVMYR